MVHVGCHVLCCVLLSLTRDMVLGMDWLYAIDHWINWNAYSLSLDCRGHTTRIMGTEYGCCFAHIELCALKLVLKTMHCDEISAWFGIQKCCL